MKETHILKTAGKDHFLKDEKEEFKLVLKIMTAKIVPFSEISL